MIACEVSSHARTSVVNQVFVALSAEPFLSACPQWLSVITAHQDVTHFTDMTCSLVSQ
jgi:type IV pilus biogenesis protein CpaD/CtpE